jgi:U32 family peptidase
MKLTTYANHLHDLNLIKDLKLGEVILGHRSFSRFGLLDDDHFLKLAARAKELGLRVLFEWDILMTEDILLKLSQEIHKFLPSIDVIRVQDPGALNWVMNQTQMPVQFIAENGNHNLKALQTWVSFIGKRLDRLVLSIELTREHLKSYLSSLNTPCEILGLGRILLFYTPRSLLTPLRTADNNEHAFVSAQGESEESPHKGFPIIENKHGTFMFHIKDFSLLEFANELREFGLHTMRLDFRWTDLNLIKEVFSLINEFQSHSYEVFKENYPQELMKGFYLVNKTDVLFPKLKNSRLQKREGNFLGEVIEVEKSEYLAIHVKNKRGLHKDDVLKIIHPQGKEFEVKIYSLKDINKEDILSAPQNKICLIQFVGGVWVKSQVFLAYSLKNPEIDSETSIPE